MEEDGKGEEQIRMDTKTEPVTRFKYVRTLEEDPLAKRVVLLGSIDDEQAILTLEKTGFSQTVEPERLLRQVRTIASNDVYWWGTTLAEQDVEKDPTCKYSLVYQRRRRTSASTRAPGCT